MPAQSKVEQQFYSVADVATILGLAQETIRELVAKGELKAIKLGETPRSRLRIHRDDLDAFIDARRKA